MQDILCLFITFFSRFTRETRQSTEDLIAATTTTAAVAAATTETGKEDWTTALGTFKTPPTTESVKKVSQELINTTTQTVQNCTEPKPITRNVCRGKYLGHIDSLRNQVRKIKEEMSQCLSIQEQLGSDLETCLFTIYTNKLKSENDLSECKLEKDLVALATSNKTDLNITEFELKINKTMEINKELVAKVIDLEKRELQHLKRIKMMENKTLDELDDFLTGTENCSNTKTVFKELLKNDCLNWVIATSLMLGFLSLESGYLILLRFITR